MVYSPYPRTLGDVITKAALSPAQLFKDPECWSGPS